MKTMKKNEKTLMISLSDIDRLPCSAYYEFIVYNYGTDRNIKFNVFDVFKTIRPLSSHISWLITFCKLAQTKDMLRYYKSQKPCYTDVIWLMINCKYAQTQAMIDYLLKLKPDFQNMFDLIKESKFAENNKKIINYMEERKKIEENIKFV